MYYTPEWIPPPPLIFILLKCKYLFSTRAESSLQFPNLISKRRVNMGSVDEHLLDAQNNRKNCLIEMVLLNANNMFWLINKKIDFQYHTPNKKPNISNIDYELQPTDDEMKILVFLIVRELTCNMILSLNTHRFSQFSLKLDLFDFVCLFDLILYVPSTIFQLNRDRSSWVEPVLS